MNSNVICILAKNPKPGKVKKLLEECLGKKQAALLARAFLMDTISTALRVTNADTVIAHWPSDAERDFHEILEAIVQEIEDKDVARRISDIGFLPQTGNHLGDTLVTIEDVLFQRGAGRILFVCSDNPLLEPLILRASFELLKTSQVVLGPTFDGGQYILGVDKAYPSLFDGISWGTENVYRQFSERLTESGLRWQELELAYDIDRPDELEQLYCDIDNLRLAGENDLCHHTEKCLASLKR